MSPLARHGDDVRRGFLVLLHVLLLLLATFLVALVAANVRLARDVLRRRPHFTPAFLRVDLPALGRSGASLLASLVSLTPGSITVDLNEAGDQLYLHTVYAPDPEEARRSVLALARLVAQAAGTEGGRTTTRGSP